VGAHVDAGDPDPNAGLQPLNVADPQDLILIELIAHVGHGMAFGADAGDAPGPDELVPRRKVGDVPGRGGGIRGWIPQGETLEDVSRRRGPGYAAALFHGIRAIGASHSQRLVQSPEKAAAVLMKPVEGAAKDEVLQNILWKGHSRAEVEQ